MSELNDLRCEVKKLEAEIVARDNCIEAFADKLEKVECNYDAWENLFHVTVRSICDQIDKKIAMYKANPLTTCEHGLYGDCKQCED